MRFDLKTHETLILLAGLAGLLEQEMVRVFLGLEPNSLMAGGFITLVLAGAGISTVRNVRKKNGENGDGST